MCLFSDVLTLVHPLHTNTSTLMCRPSIPSCLRDQSFLLLCILAHAHLDHTLCSRPPPSTCFPTGDLLESLVQVYMSSLTCSSVLFPPHGAAELMSEFSSESALIRHPSLVIERQFARLTLCRKWCSYSAASSSTTPFRPPTSRRALASLSLPSPSPIPDTASRQLQEYLDNTYDLDETLFSGITGKPRAFKFLSSSFASDESAFYKCPDRLRLPLVFYVAHPAVVFVNKMMLAGLIKERVNPTFEALFETGVDEMSWDDTVRFSFVALQRSHTNS